MIPIEGHLWQPRRENGSLRLSLLLGLARRQRLQSTVASLWVHLPGSNPEREPTISCWMQVPTESWKGQIGFTYGRCSSLLQVSPFWLSQTLNNFTQRSSFLCNRQGPRPVDWELFQEVREALAVGRYPPPSPGLAPVVGGSSPASGATSMGWMRQQVWGEGLGFSGGGPGPAPLPSVSEGSPENSLTWQIFYSKADKLGTRNIGNIQLGFNFQFVDLRCHLDSRLQKCSRSGREPGWEAISPGISWHHHRLNLELVGIINN